MSIEELVKNTDFPAPRLTEDIILDNIEGEQYYVWPGTTTTICRLQLKNGFDVYGFSACAHAGNFNIVIGQEIARKKAIESIWPLMGYELRSHLHAIERPNAPNPNPHIRYDGPPVVTGELPVVLPDPGPIRYLTADELKGSGPVRAVVAETAASLVDVGTITADEAAKATPTS